jgi:putative transposase
MPVKNTLRKEAPQSYYHIYNRTSEPFLFGDDNDYQYFQKQLRDLLIAEEKNNNMNVCLIAFCLMPTHFHFLLYQENISGIKGIMQSLMTRYSMYYNKKYSKRGHLFESRYKASLIIDDSYLLHLTRYIHLNPQNYKNYEYSSYKDYITIKRDFIKNDIILELLGGAKEYEIFTNNYDQYKKDSVILKTILAD